MTVVSSPVTSGTGCLFAYGSLMCADIMAEVTGVRLPSSPATLAGYRRLLVRDEQYPGVIPAQGSIVAGQVYCGIDARGWARLDRFEGGMYRRVGVVIRSPGQDDAQVDCYVFRPEFAHRLTDQDWDFAAFLHSGKTLFQQQYCGFKAID